ncbi:MAG TPA: PIN domain-containing protein [Thermoleophilaceae bacterium]|nr:PIN domain-containing protein [Thermoleophilaceae bacterium]
MELADTSAWWVADRDAVGPLREDFAQRLVTGSIATCDMVRFELLHSARKGREMAETADELAAVPDCPIGGEQWQRALWVYQRLADQGGAHHRSVGYPDLLIAAAAEAAGATVLHYDEDYERIAEITGQPTRWIAPRGSL